MSRARCVLRRVGVCESWLHRHHIISKQAIKRVVAADRRRAALADERNLIALCNRHHHRITHGWDRAHLRPLLVKRLDDLRAFAAEYGLEAELDRALRPYAIDPDDEGS